MTINSPEVGRPEFAVETEAKTFTQSWPDSFQQRPEKVTLS
jgi:hypothetical protein